MKATAFSSAPPAIIATVAILQKYLKRIFCFQSGRQTVGKDFFLDKVVFEGNAGGESGGELDVVHGAHGRVGAEVFFANLSGCPITATKPVRVAAVVSVLTSLLSEDMMYYCLADN